MRKILLLFAVLLGSVLAIAQGYRWDIPVYTTQGSGQPFILALPNAVIALCQHPANAVPCTNYVSTYTDSTLTTACSNTTQVVLQGYNVCQSTGDANGNAGAWLNPNGIYTTPGTFDYTLTVGGVTYGPFTATVGLISGEPGNYSNPGPLCSITPCAVNASSVTLGSTVLVPPAGSGTNNTGVGSQVLINATTSDNNVAVGNQALWKTTSGGGSNVAVGYAALGNNTTGGGNTAIGATALVNNTSGGSNTAVGDSALYYNTTGGVANTAVGYDALENNTSGQENSALGQYALQSNTTQNGSTAVGAYALQAATAASTMLPGLAKNVPGTTAHHNLQENKEQQQIATDVAQNKSEAETAKNKAEAAAKLAPPGKEEEWSVVPNIAGPNGEPVQQEKHSGQIRVAPGLPAGVKTTKEGKAITPEMLYMQAHPNATAEELQNFLGKPVSAKDAKALNDTWNPIAQKAGLPANQFREGMTTAEVSQLAAALNGAIGKQQGAQKIVIEQGNANQAAEKAGTKWMMWPETETGRTIAGPLSMAEAQNATDIAEVPAQEVRDIINARGAVRIMTKVGDPKNPETNGTLQLIDSLDKDKKLGLLASRWNSFMTSGVGASPDDDPRIITLMNKNMLGDTATMLAHFGASGGRSPQMLQHFMDLANAKKMDAVTLKAGIKAMADYMQDKGMMPSKQGGGKGGGANNPPTGSIKVTDPNGGTHYFKDQAAADNFKKLAGIK